MEILDIKDGDCLLVRFDIECCDYQSIYKSFQHFIKEMGLQNVHYLILPDQVQVDILRPEVQTEKFI